MEEILKENTIQDFVVTENTEKQNEITLLKKGDIEQLGIYLCTHCGVAFGSEIQRTCISEYLILVDFVFLVLADSNSKVEISLIRPSCDIEP
ncbi:MAG: hypothetical protein WA220_05070 [Candidatus Nitrosopolaris sp.]